MKIKNPTTAKLPADKFHSRPAADSMLYQRKNQAFNNRAGVDFQTEIEQIQTLIDEGVSRQAHEKAIRLLDLKPRDANLLARIRLLLSKSLELQARYADGFEFLKPYQNEEIRYGLENELDLEIQTQIALLYNYLSESPKSVSLLKEILGEAIELEAGERVFGLINLSLSRAYRSLGQTAISRGYAEQALQLYREAPDWRGMVQCYIALSNLTVQEGKYEEFVRHSRQALNIIGERPENYWLGRIYAELAGAYYFLHRPHDGIACLEKATRYFEQTEHYANLLTAYNNLGINLIVIGEWKRAEAYLLKSVEIADRIKHSSLSMAHDSLGELYLLKEQFEDAKEHLEKAVAFSRQQNRKWYLVQSLKNWGRYHIAVKDFERAGEIIRQYLETARQVDDAGAIKLAHLHFADIYLHQEKFAEFEAEIADANLRDDDDNTDLLITAFSQYLLGRFAKCQNDLTLAEYHFNRSLSLYEIVKDFYYAAVCRFELGAVLSEIEPKRAAEHLDRAAEDFRKLGIERLSELIEAVRAQLSKSRAEAKRKTPNIGLLALRLTESAASRELLFHEFSAILQQESKAKKILIAQPDAEKNLTPAAFAGFSSDEAEKLAADFERANKRGEIVRFSETNNLAVFKLRESSDAPAFLLLSPRAGAKLADNSSLQPLVKIVELGLEVCALRERNKTVREMTEADPARAEGLLPGFIHSSPGMTTLVEEIYKIRTSDITVLITGESGTGKELVSRAIHRLSNRKDRIFVPFNSTAVPKELAEGHLFGYKKGAFTGAMNDAPGVIRSADGGTLFLDEIGDLPLDVQPKLLRFLQEGEIQPLGEKKPLKVDVRVVAATNVGLEEKVAAGLFREDLYYRLNVIRLRVPPLRERRSEIPQMINYYVNHYSERFHKRGVSITPQTVDLLMVCDWEGNVRQLCNELQRLVVRAEDNEVITPEHLSPELRRTAVPLSAVNGNNRFAADLFSNVFNVSPENGTLDKIVSEIESRVIVESLKRHKGNISRVARELGISRRGLYMKLERYGLIKPSNPLAKFNSVF